MSEDSKSVYVKEFPCNDAAFLTIAINESKSADFLNT